MLSRRWPQTEEERFWAKVQKTETCWLWTGASRGRVGGYGYFTVGGKGLRAHRWAYEQLREPIPSGMTIDHLCRVPACVNPDHLQVVSMRTNVLRSNNLAARNNRKTHCKREHAFTAENTYVNPRGRRECRICRKAARP